ncbi:glycosyltransferase family 2 protein [Hyaloscypha variabilis]
MLWNASTGCVASVTIDSKLQEMQSIVTKTSKDVAGSSTKVMVLSIPLAGKRRQMAHGIQRVLADDDVFWPPMLLPYLLACFEVPEVGGVGTRQHAHVPPDAALSLWQYLAARRLEKRNISISASNYIDGGVTCLSGRTLAYRAEILKDEAFISAFTHDFWRGRYLLDSGDDTFITRWLYSKNWAVKIQTELKAEISTIVVDSPRYLQQLIR